MSFHIELERQTANARRELLSLPLFADALAGRVTVPMYIGFLTEAYHHVKHTVPLMMACGARLTDEYEWLRAKLVSYIEEEYGHHEWILKDIEACGGDAEAVRRSCPSMATEIMVAYAYDTVNRRNPAGFFGMVHVLEGTSVALASVAAERIAGALKLPPRAFTYLSSHGSLDVEHRAFFDELVNNFTQRKDRDAVVHASRVFSRLYGDIFRQLHLEYSVCESKIALAS